MKNTLMLRRIAAITLVLFSLTFGASLFVTVNTVEATDNLVHWFPYTRYYTCGSPGTNSYGIVHTESGRDKSSYYFDYMNSNDEHYAPLFWVIPPHLPGAYWVKEHIDHSVTFYTFEETVEYINLDSDHWRCR